MLKVPPAGPSCKGLNVTLTVQLDPGWIAVEVQSSDSANPDGMEIAYTANAPEPELVIVTGWGALVVPSTSLPNGRLVGEIFTVVGAPMPNTPKPIVPAREFVLKEKLPLVGPAWPGVK